jgi:hypothetical protein
MYLGKRLTKRIRKIHPSLYRSDCLVSFRRTFFADDKRYGERPGNRYLFSSFAKMKSPAWTFADDSAYAMFDERLRSAVCRGKVWSGRFPHSSQRRKVAGDPFTEIRQYLVKVDQLLPKQYRTVSVLIEICSMI